MITITPMTPRDLAAVAEIERSCHFEPWSEEGFRGELERECGCACVAREGGEPCEAACGEAAHDEPSGAWALDAFRQPIAGYVCFWILLDEVHILNVTVRDGCRRKGYGRALVLHALETGWRRGARRALLEVRAGNAAALALYRRLGFETVGQRPGYYGTPREPALLMELQMNDAWRRVFGSNPFLPAEK